MRDFYGTTIEIELDLDYRKKPEETVHHLDPLDRFRSKVQPLISDESICSTVEALARHANGNAPQLESAVQYLAKGDNARSAEIFASMAHYYAEDEAAYALGLAHHLDPDEPSYLDSLKNLDNRPVFVRGLWNFSED